MLIDINIGSNKKISAQLPAYKPNSVVRERVMGAGKTDMRHTCDNSFYRNRYSNAPTGIMQHHQV